MKTILVFAPHPDDAEFYAGGTLALWEQQGHRIILVTVTDGNKGSYIHFAEELTRLRREEAKKAAEILGVSEILFLDYHDQELDLLPAGVLREQFVRLIRNYQPDVLVAEDVLFKEEPHPDHRAVALAAADAVFSSGLPLVYPQHLEEGLKPHFVAEKYFYSEDPDLTDKIIDITGTFDKKMEALAAHKTQVEFLVDDLVRQAIIAGVEENELLLIARQNPLQALTLFMHQQAELMGSQDDHELGEAFRYVRFHPLVESILPG
ncbi:MAG: PIG-L deacetylase family protein [Anaerolineaceae bacterium]